MSAAQTTIAGLPVDNGVKEFLNSGLVLVRNTFLNQAPTVKPVQVTGKISGLIVGTIGAVDPDGDRIVYTLTKAPKTGTVQLNPDGTYTYTPGAGFTGVDTFTVSAADPGLHINVLDLFRAPSTAATSVINQGAITFDFRYGDGSEYWTPERRQALKDAANDLVQYFTVTTPVTLSYNIIGLYGTGFASGGSPTISSAAGFYPTVVQNKLLTGVDSNGAAVDGTIDVNWAEDWAIGNTVGEDQYDFTSTMMHEILHTFGFETLMDPPPADQGDNWPLFAKLIVTADGTKVFNTDGSWNPKYNSLLTGGVGSLFFGGANATAAYGKPVPLYTPKVWSGGSSVTHLDDDTFTGDQQKLMNANTGTGPGVRTLSPIEIGILTDLGYTVAAPQSLAPAAVPPSVTASLIAA